MPAPRNRRVLPGFSLSLGYTVFYLSLLVLIPLAALLRQGGVADAGAVLGGRLDRAGAGRLRADVRRVARRGGGQRRARAAHRLGAGALRVPAASGSFDALVDLPFALPTAVAGLVYSSLYVENGWLGQFLVPLGHQGGVLAARRSCWCWSFTGFPFVVRTVQPVLESLDAEARGGRRRRSGRSRWQTFRRVLLPTLLPGAADRLRAGVRPRRWASTARWCSSPATCRSRPRSRRC